MTTAVAALSVERPVILKSFLISILLLFIGILSVNFYEGRSRQTHDALLELDATFSMPMVSAFDG
jgi:hypothetical protein